MLLIPVLIFGFVLVLNLLAPLGLHVWGRSVARWQGGGWWRKAAWVPILGLGAAVIGMAWTVSLMVQVFETVAALEPSQKQSALQQGIQQAMRPWWMFSAVSWGLNAVSFVLFLVGTLKRPRA